MCSDPQLQLLPFRTILLCMTRVHGECSRTPTINFVSFSMIFYGLRTNILSNKGLFIRLKFDFQRSRFDSCKYSIFRIHQDFHQTSTWIKDNIYILRFGCNIEEFNQISKEKLVLDKFCINLVDSERKYLKYYLESPVTNGPQKSVRKRVQWTLGIFGPIVTVGSPTHGPISC